eukprot:jgi/Tetstr1/443967/TSEL_031918.t1
MTGSALALAGAAVPSAQERAVTELVEAALDSEDVLPLVRVVFDSKKPVAEHGGGRGSGAEDPSSRLGSRRSSLTGGAEASEHSHSQRSIHSAALEVGVLDGGDAAGVMDALLTVQDGQEMEIERLCRTHYVDISRCSEEIASMACPISNMKETLFDNNYYAQQCGGQLAERLQEGCELSMVKERLEASKSVVENCTTALELCDEAWRLIENKKPYRALRLSQRIAQLANDSCAETRQPVCDALTSLRRLGTSAGSAQPAAADLGILRPFIASQAAELAWAVEQEVLSDFKEWMVQVREKAAGIGQRAIRRAAQQRLSEDEVIAETRALQASLLACRDPRKAASLCAGIRGVGADAAADEEANAGRLLGALDMTPLYRAHHICQTLGKGAWFQGSYLDNRRQQMTTDLTPSKPFVDVYQPYLNQVVGFFLVEDQVLRASSGITSGAAVDGLWENALSQIKTALLGAYERLEDPNALLLVKDFVHLVCRALAACSFHVTPIEEILSNGRSRYHDLLLKNAVQQFTDVIKADDMRAAMKATTEQQLEALKEAGLPHSLDSRAPKHAVLAQLEPPRAAEATTVKLPHSAPFSTMVPQLVKVMKRFIADSAAYLRGIMGPGELLHIVRQFRDNLISKVLSEILVSRITASGQPMAAVMQLTANIWALKFCLPTLDDFTVEHSRQARWQMGTSSGAAPHGSGSSKGSGSRSLASVSEAAASLETLQGRAEAHATGELARQLDYILASAITAVNWVPEAPPTSAGVCSDYVEKAVIYMQKHLGQAKDILPPESHRRMCIATIRHCAKSMMDTLHGPGIQKFNIFAVRQLDINIEAVEMYTSSLSTTPPHDFIAEFAVLRDLLRLLQADKAEALNDDAAVSAAYPHLVSSSPVMTSIAVILDKYRDAGSLLQRSGRQEGPRRKDITEVSKRLCEMASKGVNKQAS